MEGDLKPEGEVAEMKAALHRPTPSQSRPNCGAPLHPPSHPLGKFGKLVGVEDPK